MWINWYAIVINFVLLYDHFCCFDFAAKTVGWEEYYYIQESCRQELSLENEIFEIYFQWN